jgi:hypothetical protein
MSLRKILADKMLQFARGVFAEIVRKIPRFLTGYLGGLRMEDFAVFLARLFRSFTHHPGFSGMFMFGFLRPAALGAGRLANN